MAHTSARRRRVLVPLASLLAATAIAIGSGATFTSQTENPGNTYAAGTLQHTNSRDGLTIFDVSNMKPGDTVNGTVTITSSGSLAQKLSVTETATNGFAEPAKLTLEVTDVTDPASPAVVAGPAQFGSLGTLDLGTWAPGESRTYKFTVTLAGTAGNANQGTSATATYTWNGTQTDPVVVDQP